MQKQLSFKRAIILATMLLLPTTPFAQNASFQGLGHIYNGFVGYQSEAYGVSYDGSVVVGVSTSIYDGQEVYEAFRWTEAEGIEGIGTITDDNFFSFARGVSYDGSVIVGYSRSELASIWEAFRWTETEGMIGLGDIVSEEFWSESKDVSADGAIVTGLSYAANEGFRWENGQMENITEEGVIFSEAWGISGNGKVIVGTLFDGNNQQGFRWTAENGLQGIGTAPGGNYVIARKTSYDGTVIVGGMGIPEGREAFLWTENGGIMGIGNFPGNFFSEANDVSDDGEIIIGMAHYSDETQAFIWTENEGLQNLKELLENNFELNLDGWTLTSATAISGDGSTIVGYGINPDGNQEAWRVVLAKNMSSNDVANNETIIYPNPTTGIINLQTKEKINSVSIYNLVGQKVSFNSLNQKNNSIDISNLSSGIYFIEVILNDKTIKRHKVIKK